MSSAESLRDFVNETLTAAAEQIFRLFQRTVVEYEGRLERQRRQLDSTWRPEVRLHRIDLLQQKEEAVLAQQQLWNQDRNSGADQEDPEPPQIKDEEEELCTSQLVLKVEVESFVVTPTDEQSDNSTVLLNNSYVAETQDEKGYEHEDSTRAAELDPNNQQYDNESKLQKHMTPTGKKLHTCSTCGKTFKQTGNLYRHIRCVHSSDRPCVCKICGKRFSEPQKLKQHQKVHTGERPYVCTTCGKAFGHSSNLKVHIRAVHTHEKPYVCATCGKAFVHSASLTSHVRRAHTGERPYLCKICGKAFYDMSVLKKHQRIHTNEKPFTCTTCGRGFREKGTLTVHIRYAHSGERLYRCTTCGHVFAQSSSLTSHIRHIHNGERPHLCNTCGKTFVVLSNLKKHMVTHTGERAYACNI